MLQFLSCSVKHKNVEQNIEHRFQLLDKEIMNYTNILDNFVRTQNNYECGLYMNLNP